MKNKKYGTIYTVEYRIGEENEKMFIIKPKKTTTRTHIRAILIFTVIMYTMTPSNNLTRTFKIALIIVFIINHQSSFLLKL